MKSTNDNAESPMKESTSMNQDNPATSMAGNATPASDITNPNSLSPGDAESLDAESTDFDELNFDFELKLSDTLPEMDIIFENLYTM